MKVFLITICSLAFLSVLFLNSATGGEKNFKDLDPKKMSCEEQLSYLSNSLGSFEAVRVRPALTEVLSRQMGLDASQRLRPIPSLSEPDFTENWERRQKQSVEISMDRVKMEKLAQNNPNLFYTGVYRIGDDGKYLFKDFHERKYSPVRYEVAAFRLSQSMALGLVPKAEYAVVNQRFGILTEIVRGSQIDGDVPKSFQDWVSSGKISKDSASDFEAFVFLIGEVDHHDENFVVTSHGQIHSFDHGDAFQNISTPYKTKVLPFVGSLPDTYTSRFVEGLKRLDVQEVRKLLGGDLSPNEIEALLFRREIILEDMRRRGFIPKS